MPSVRTELLNETDESESSVIFPVNQYGRGVKQFLCHLLRLTWPRVSAMLERV